MESKFQISLASFSRQLRAGAPRYQSGPDDRVALRVSGGRDMRLGGIHRFDRLHRTNAETQETFCLE